MKDKRNYNVFFNTHTVSGIVISVGLFVCFFAGAFALFQTNINKWEANAKNKEKLTVDYEKTLTTIKKKGYVMDGRTFFIQMMDNPLPFIMVISRPLRAEKNTNTQKKEQKNYSEAKVEANGPISVKIDPDTYQIVDQYSAESTEYLGTFLYHLHYFDQIPKVGLYISGLVSLFFLFAIITGTIIHWKKIVSNFFTFRLKASIKNLWSDAHVALGIIGLPFQFMYAVTGALFGLVILVLLPSTIVLFGGDQGKLLEYIAPAYKTFDMANETHLERPNINQLIQNARKELHIDDTVLASVNVSNYNDKNAHIMAEFRVKKEGNFYDDAYITYRLRDGKIVEKKMPETHPYKSSVLHTVRKLHFAQFGGYLVKTIYFLLSLITCFVILSGVMLWLEARNNKMYEKKKKFNTAIGAIYLGASMGLFPAIAFFFCITKIIPLDIENRFGLMSNAFFLFWLAYTLYAFISKDFHKINKHALILAGILGIAIPFLNGLQSGLWFWTSLQSNYIDSFFIDISWLLLGVISLITAFSVQRLVSHKDKRKTKNSTSKNRNHQEVIDTPILAMNESISTNN
ncbi:PepSY-associated TM helix domain-containing protein [Aquimarina aquimarini]|uniref:PepSY-associated TM helix domain-containing protein n=1 Tax=Aquimarina aquimarini TaxID=1191734 RepID=UPI000D5626E3|nr:PepSY-associated TM helix domain-containing protein [Aquimarina aquimarini]